MNYFYSKSTNGFYISEMNGDKTPDDSVEITHDEWLSIMEGQSKGMVVSSDEKGKPTLTNPPEKTSEQYISEAEMKKISLLELAVSKKSPLQDAVDIGKATDYEIALLEKWKQYSVAVNRIDTSIAPDITWPAYPTL